MAATVFLAAGVTIWWSVNQNGQRTGHAVVQSIDGSLYVVAADGLHPLLKGADLPVDAELRTAKDSDAVLQLADGSTVEVRERSSLSTSPSGNDLTIRLASGSILVQAAHRKQGHLFVDTGDCRVAVTGTVFGVTSGMKGSRVSVLEGEVHVTQDNPGEDSPLRRPDGNQRQCGAGNGGHRYRLEPQSCGTPEETEEHPGAGSPTGVAL